MRLDRVLGLGLLFFAGQPLAAEVIVVDDSGTADHTSIQAAVDAATDGDTVLVRSGLYSGFTIANRALVVTADSGATVLVDGAVRVTDLALGKNVLLAGLHATGIPDLADDLAGHGLVLVNDFGRVRVSDSSFVGADNFDPVGPEDCVGFADNNGFHGAFVQNCSDVVLHASSFQGGDGLVLPDDLDGIGYCGFVMPGGAGGHGVFADDARIVVHDSTATGGDGEYGGWGGRGGDGYRSTGLSQVHAGGSAFTGGEGGVGFDFFFGPGGTGGDGILTLGSTETSLRDNQAAGGAGGASVVFEAGEPGQGVEVYGPLDEFAQAARRTSAASPVREGELLEVELTGEAGDTALLLAGVPGTLFLPVFQAPLLTHATPVLVAVGPVGPDGTTQLAAPVGGISDVLEAVHLTLQGLFVSSGGIATLASAQELVLLDAAF